MRQVPTTSAYRYAIIGAGRVATHFAHYFNLLDIPYDAWSRSQSIELPGLHEIVADSTHVLLLISDSAIDGFVEQYAFLQEKVLIHFSGCLESKYAYSAHPLMTFTDTLQDMRFYQHIPFILDQNQITFSELLPGLHNQHFMIQAQQKPLYHALCVMANNFTTILWQKYFHSMNAQLNIPEEVLKPLLEQTCCNLLQNPSGALTGPLIRGDTVSIDKNLSALAGDPFQQVYQAMVNAFAESKEKKDECESICTHA